VTGAALVAVAREPTLDRLDGLPALHRRQPLWRQKGRLHGARFVAVGRAAKPRALTARRVDRRLVVGVAGGRGAEGVARAVDRSMAATIGTSLGVGAVVTCVVVAHDSDSRSGSPATTRYEASVSRIVAPPSPPFGCVP
jgi:hypothetical protein